MQLASRNQDLVPRVLLVTNKIHYFAKISNSTEWEAVVVRSEEYQALLGEPKSVDILSLNVTYQTTSTSNVFHFVVWPL